MRMVEQEPATVDLDEFTEVRDGSPPPTGWAIDGARLLRNGGIIGTVLLILRRRDGQVTVTYRPRPRPHFDGEVPRGRIPCEGRR